jgi:hypothetical protein
LTADPLLPATIPITTAATLAGLSPTTFKARCLQTKAVDTEDGRVVLASLERHLGEPITPERYLKADRARDRARAAQNNYRRQQRGNADGTV